MNFDTTVDHDAEEVTIVYNDSIVLRISKLDSDNFKYSNFHKIEDEGEEVVDILKKLAIDLLSIT